MDTNCLHLEAWAQAFEEVGERPSRSSIHHEIGKGSDKLISEFVADGEASQHASELHGEFYAKLQDRGHPLPGAKELLASLADRGYEVWFATSAKPEELEHHMEELEAEGKVAGVVSSEEVEGTKPAPDIFELALKRAGSSPEETVAVGARCGTSSPPRKQGEDYRGDDRWGVQPGRARRGGGLCGLRRLCTAARGRVPRGAGTDRLGSPRRTPGTREVWRSNPPILNRRRFGPVPSGYTPQSEPEPVVGRKEHGL